MISTAGRSGTTCITSTSSTSDTTSTTSSPSSSLAAPSSSAAIPHTQHLPDCDGSTIFTISSENTSNHAQFSSTSYAFRPASHQFKVLTYLGGGPALTTSSSNLVVSAGSSRSSSSSSSSCSNAINQHSRCSSIGTSNASSKVMSDSN
jgi:hypothetical protein